MSISRCFLSRPESPPQPLPHPPAHPGSGWGWSKSSSEQPAAAQSLLSARHARTRTNSDQQDIQGTSPGLSIDTSSPVPRCLGLHHPPSPACPVMAERAPGGKPNLLLPGFPSQTRSDRELPRLGISASGLWLGPRQEKARTGGQVGRKTHGQAGSTEGARGTAALQQGETLLAGSEGTEEESRGKGGARRGCISGCQSSYLERSHCGGSCLWCQAPWEGGGRERGSAPGELVPRAEGRGLSRAVIRPTPGQPGAQRHSG